MFRAFRFLQFIFFSTGLFLIINSTYVLSSSGLNYKKYIDTNLNNFQFLRNAANNDNLQNALDINNLYSQKEIVLKGPPINEVINNEIDVIVKVKPINPSIIKKLNKSLNYNNTIFEVAKLDLSEYSAKKREFIQVLLPLISYENNKIIIQRKELKNIRSLLIKNKTLSNENIERLFFIAKKYKIKNTDKHKLDLVNELLLSVDIIPTSIVLAQAANESGWGKSRFAMEYNAIFGEYTYDFSSGVLPLNREEGANHLVKAFSSIDQSVESYFNNINTHSAYSEFRELRKVMRNKNNFSNISFLVERLSSYAADKNYSKTLNSIIKSNKLDKFNSHLYFDLAS